MDNTREIKKFINDLKYIQNMFQYMLLKKCHCELYAAYIETFILKS